MPCGQALNFSTCHGALRIATGDGTDPDVNIMMHDFAWDIPNLMPLWLRGEVRGDDVLIPGVAGVVSYRRRATVSGYSLPLTVTGQVDPAGNPTALDPWEQLESNLLVLDAIVEPPGTVAGTREATLTMPSGAVRTAAIHVLGITPGETLQAVLVGTLDISIPTGAFA